LSLFNEGISNLSKKCWLAAGNAGKEVTLIVHEGEA
jgi:hypothetical protein